MATGRKVLVDLIQHPFYRCQFDPHRADAGHRVVIVGEATTPRVHCRIEIVGEEVRNGEEDRWDINVPDFCLISVSQDASSRFKTSARKYLL
jgi:hypothetical protein